jgi:hypothetical protein
MADVDGVANGRKRGQLIFIGGLSLALTFVALALILNSVIYSENLATRNNDASGGQDAAQFREDVQQGVSDLTDQVNQKYTDDTTLNDEIRKGISDWSEYTARYYEIDGTTIRVTVTRVVVDTTSDKITLVELRIVYTGPRTQYEATIQVSP